MKPPALPPFPLPHPPLSTSPPLPSFTSPLDPTDPAAGPSYYQQALQTANAPSMQCHADFCDHLHLCCMCTRRCIHFEATVCLASVSAISLVTRGASRSSRPGIHCLPHSKCKNANPSSCCGTGTVLGILLGVASPAAEAAAWLILTYTYRQAKCRIVLGVIKYLLVEDIADDLSSTGANAGPSSPANVQMVAQNGAQPVRQASSESLVLLQTPSAW